MRCKNKSIVATLSDELSNVSLSLKDDQWKVKSKNLQKLMVYKTVLNSYSFCTQTSLKKYIFKLKKTGTTEEQEKMMKKQLRLE